MKKYFLITLLFCTICSWSTKADNWYYLSSLGYLIRLDLENITETGQVAAGIMPWGATSCEGHIYFSDFATDQVYDFSVEDKVLNKVKIDSEPNNIIELVTKEDKTYKKPVLRVAFEKIRKPKKQVEKYDPSSEPLAIAAHNKKFGLGAIACTPDHVFVVSTLKDRIEVLQRTNFQHIASLLVGERPSHLAINPEQNILAITSTALNKVYLSDLKNNFARLTEFSVEEGPTEMAWLENRLFVLNRGQNSISVIDPNQKEIIKNISFETAINSLTASAKENKLYVLDGNEKKVYLVNGENYQAEVKEIKEPLKFPNIINLINDSELLVGSETDGRFLILDTKNFESVKKIQTNLPPHLLVKFKESKTVATEQNNNK